MRVLLVAHAYPPAAASGAQRAANVAKALRSAGHDVHVLTTRLERAGAARPGERVIEVRMGRSGADVVAAVGRLRSALRRRVGSADAAEDATNGSGADEVLQDPDDPGPTLRRWITTILRFPSGHLGFLIPAFRAGVASGPFDVVYTTGPPVTTQLVGLALHAATGTPWVAEFRDPWILGGGPYRPASLRTAGTDAVERWLEGRCQAAAAEVVAVSEGIGGLLADRRARLGRPRPHVVLNGIPDFPPPVGGRSGPIRIVHLGNLYAYRDPALFLEALAEHRGEYRWRPSDVEVRFVGAPPPEAVQRLVVRLGLDDVVRFEPWVRHEMGQSLIRNADILLLLAQRQPFQIPNKLYEYLGTRNPILAFADSEGETAHMLRGVGNHGLVTELDDSEAAVSQLRRLIAEARSIVPVAMRPEPEALLKAWTTERQLAALPGILQQACGH